MIAMIMAAMAAVGQPDCATFVNTQVRPISFVTAVASMKPARPKSEYETADQWFNSLPHYPTMIIAKQLLLPNLYVKYDAESQKLLIDGEAFDRDDEESTFKALLNSAYYDFLNPSTQDIAVAVARTNHDVGSYVGATAMGARARVTKVASTNEFIFEGPSPTSDDRGPIWGRRILFPDADERGIVGELALSPEEAKALKPKLHAAFVVEPKPPFVVRVGYHEQSPTYDTPQDVEERDVIIVADLKCALLMDDRDRVLASYLMR
jgi:hypothetical protein